MYRLVRWVLIKLIYYLTIGNTIIIIIGNFLSYYGIKIHKPMTLANNVQ